MNSDDGVRQKTGSTHGMCDYGGFFGGCKTPPTLSRTTRAGTVRYYCPTQHDPLTDETAKWAFITPEVTA